MNESRIKNQESRRLMVVPILARLVQSSRLNYVFEYRINLNPCGSICKIEPTKSEKYHRVIIISLSSIFYLLSSIATALAQSTATTCAGDKCKLPDPLGTTSVPELVGRFLKTITPFLGVGAVIMFVIGAIHWILSSGNPEKVKKGQDTVIWAVLGTAVAIGSYLALQFIIKVITGGNLLKFTNP